MAHQKGNSVEFPAKKSIGEGPYFHIMFEENLTTRKSNVIYILLVGSLVGVGVGSTVVGFALG